ncbi:MAG: hypothetical protein ACK5V5_11645 [Cyclobacteriaceae bacterium]|jgi:hypothetical protein
MLGILNKHSYFFLLLCIASCQPRQQNPQTSLLGDWIIVKSEIELVYGAKCFPFSNFDLPFRFHLNDSMIISEMGLYQYDSNERFIGNQTRYKVVNDSLFIYDFLNNDWLDFYISYSQSDSIILEDEMNHFVYLKRVALDTPRPNGVSKVTVEASTSSLNCMSYKVEFTRNCTAHFVTDSIDWNANINRDDCAFFWSYVDAISFPHDSKDYYERPQGSHERNYELGISDGEKDVQISLSSSQGPIKLRFLLLHLENILDKDRQCRYGPTNPCASATPPQP